MRSLSCSVCKRVLPTAQFIPRPDRKRGFYSRCRDCDNERCRRYYEANPEQVLTRVRARQAALRTERKCLACGELAQSQRHWYCPSCREKKGRMRRKDTRVKASRQERGYDAAHIRLRRRWEREVALGGVLCHRPDCLRAHLPGGRLIVPGEPWDLGHDDEDRSRYRGPEHQACNRSTAGRMRRTSREW